MFGYPIWVRCLSGRITDRMHPNIGATKPGLRQKLTIHRLKRCVMQQIWIEEHHADDNWFLMVDSFDPHEPFDFPDEDTDL